MFELLGPIVELLWVAAVIAGLALGILNVSFAVLFAAVAFGYGLLLSLSAITIEEFSFFRYPRWRDLGLAVLAAIIENVGYRQLHSWWRLQGVWRAVRGHDAGWGSMVRSGFRAASPGA